MQQTHLTLLPVIILLQLLFGLTTNAMNYKVTNLECKGNSKFIINVKCKLKAISRTKSAIDMSCDIVDVLDNVSVHAQIWQKNSMNIYRPFLVNITANACDVMNKRISFIYATLALNMLKEFTNVNHTCPYRGQIFARNAYMDQRFIPVSPPTGFYKVSLRVFESYSLEDIGTIIGNLEVSDEK